MATVIANMSMSLDGFVADTADGTEQLFGWYFGGDVEVGPFRTSSEGSAAHLREAFDRVGAVVCGRRSFDLAHGWGGNHPMGVPTFIVTHRVPDGWPRADSNISFVTDGLESAVEQAKAAAGEKWVGVATPDLTRQCLDLGLLDGIAVDVVPVLLGAGVPFFADLKNAPVQLAGPTKVVEGTGVTHLCYDVRK